MVCTISYVHTILQVIRQRLKMGLPGGYGTDHQTVAIVAQGVAHVAQFAGGVAFAVEPGIGTLAPRARPVPSRSKPPPRSLGALHNPSALHHTSF